MKIPLILSCFLTFACLGNARPKLDQPYIALRPADTLYVQVTDIVYMGASQGIGERDRFWRIKQALEGVLEDIDFPLAYKIERAGSQRPPPGQPRLDITIMRWGDNGMSEIEARFSASIRRDFDRNKLGVYFMRGPTAFGGTERVIRAHNEVMEKAIAEMVRELKTRLSAGLPSDGKSTSDDENDISKSN